VKRYTLILFAISSAITCWLGMMLVHECGHVLGAWATGGTVERVVFYPTVFSRTDLGENPHPLVVAWAGPVFGAVVPLAAWGLARLFARRVVLLQMFAGWCLIANGLYIGAASFLNIADAKEMMRHGSPGWVLWVFGVAAMVPGFWLWHKLGPRFGMRADNADLRRGEVWVAAGLAIGLVVAGLVVFGRPPGEGW